MTLCFQTRDGIVHGVVFTYNRADMLRCERADGTRHYRAADLTAVYVLPVTCLWCVANAASPDRE